MSTSCARAALDIKQLATLRLTKFLGNIEAISFLLSKMIMIRIYNCNKDVLSDCCDKTPIKIAQSMRYVWAQIDSGLGDAPATHHQTNDSAGLRRSAVMKRNQTAFQSTMEGIQNR